MRRRIIACAAILLVAGCGSATITTGRSSHAASSARETSPVSSVDFACRLPIRSETLKGGFVNFPGGAFTPDPASEFTYDPGGRTFRSTGTPELSGSDPLLFYDRPLSRWLPAPRSAVYPDGSSYAYVTRSGNQTVHLVDVGSGHERTFPAAHPIGAAVFDYSQTGVYLASNLETGLWLLDSRTRSERLLTSEKIIAAVGSGKAWLSTSQHSNFFPDTVVSLDITSGSKTVWFQRDNVPVNFIGLTSDSLPVVSVQTSTGEDLWLVRSPTVAEKMYSGPRTFDFRPVSDPHGIWVGSGVSGIYLYSSGIAIRRVSDTSGAPAGSCA